MEQVTYDFGVITVADNFLIGEMKEGADVLDDAIHTTVKLAQERFGDQPWGYISHRIHPASHQPAAQVLMKKLDANLAAYAVVLGSPDQAVLLGLEQSFAQGQHAFEIFRDMDASIDWIRSVLAP